MADSAGRAAAIAAFRDPERLAVNEAGAERPVVFMFPGQGAQYPGMAAGLYQTEPVVRRIIDRCARRLKPQLGADLRRLLFPSARHQKDAAQTLTDTRYASPWWSSTG